jgi:hypothetical protein
MTAEEWVEEFAREIGLAPPDRRQVESILGLAAEAAHASERTAAPVACWMAGISGRALPDLEEAAKRVGSTSREQPG